MVTHAGYVNSHTHLYSGLAPLGMPEPSAVPKTFLEILERVWWKLDRALDADSLRAATDFYVAEALLAGTIGLVDHHESPQLIEGSLDVLADSCQELGMRAVLCYGATERNGGRREARRGIEECRRFIQSNTRPLVQGVIGLHAAFTVSDETLREAGRAARDLGTVVHLHVAEDREDVDDAVRRGYDGVIDRLIRNNVLPDGSILAHGVHLTQKEVWTCSERGWWLVQNPRSNRGNGVGYPGAIRISRNVALGTDGYPANMLDELEALRREARAEGDDLDTAADRLAAGHRLIDGFFDTDEPSEADLPAGRVMVAGCPVVRDGRLLTGDLEAIRGRAREQAIRLWRRMEDIEAI